MSWNTRVLFIGSVLIVFSELVTRRYTYGAERGGQCVLGPGCGGQQYRDGKAFNAYPFGTSVQRLPKFAWVFHAYLMGTSVWRWEFLFFGLLFFRSPAFTMLVSQPFQVGSSCRKKTKLVYSYSTIRWYYIWWHVLRFLQREDPTWNGWDTSTVKAGDRKREREREDFYL